MTKIEEYPYLAKICKEEGLDEEQTENIIERFVGTCSYCWENDAGCQCWNDE